VRLQREQSKSGAEASDNTACRKKSQTEGTESAGGILDGLGSITEVGQRLWMKERKDNAQSWKETGNLSFQRNLSLPETDEYFKTKG
jgi:hypothetical protein